MDNQQLSNLATTVAAALERMAASGIRGWGLANPDETLFERVDLGGGGGCTTEGTCSHYSHDPFAPDYKLIPLSGIALAQVGDPESGGDEGDEAWYLASWEDGRQWFRCRWPRFYWTSLLAVEECQVPAWVFAKLAPAEAGAE